MSETTETRNESRGYCLSCMRPYAQCSCATAPQVFTVHAPNGAWKQIAVVRDERIDWVELVPALLGGWNVRREWAHTSADWPGMTADRIVAWKRESDPGFLPATEAERTWVLKRLGLVP